MKALVLLVMLSFPLLYYHEMLLLSSRFVILKLVPRDLLHNLPLPPKIQEYLNTPFYYSESIAEEAAHEEALRQIAKAEAEEKASQEVNKVSESSANSTSEVANRISEEANPASEGAPS